MADMPASPPATNADVTSGAAGHHHHHNPPSLQQEEATEGGQSSSSSSWRSYISEDLPRTVTQSTDSAIRSARSFHHDSSTRIRTFQDFIPHLKTQYRTYENAFFKKVKDELVTAGEHPALAGGIAVTAGLLLMRGPRRFLFRHTLGRLQNEEAQFVRAEKNVKQLNLSVDVMKNESRKLLERAALAEKDMKRGHTELINAGNQIQSLAKSVYRAEAEAVGCFHGVISPAAEDCYRQKSNEDFRIGCSRNPNGFIACLGELIEC
ncbi:hypothetical protein RJ640_013216 [Escallonia rubra]|uniref:Uncharacterized protein n=1 Tax=Escallonia rubra TaxID=112253 RepID=A0AA88UH95_9ASTE|nr:hypothetical protein RJ640_013216 [Escallonia rubra]